MPDTSNPPAPLPERGSQGEAGEAGTEEGYGGSGGKGGRGGRGGIGLQGIQGDQGHQGKAGQRGERGKTGTIQTKLDRYALVIVVVLTALSAIYFAAVSQHRLTDANEAIALGRTQQQAADVQAACQQRVFEQIVLALKARSTFAEVQAHAGVNLDRAQQTYLNTILEPNQTRATALAALATYQQALAFNIAATRDQLRVRERHPYPTSTEVRACR